MEVQPPWDVHSAEPQLAAYSGGISVMISMRVDQVLIGQMLNDRHVGLYSGLSSSASFGTSYPLNCRLTYPSLVDAKNRSEELYYGRLQKLYDVLVTLALVVAVVMTFLSGPIVHLLYGAAYARSSEPLRILDLEWHRPFALDAPGATG